MKKSLVIIIIAILACVPALRAEKKGDLLGAYTKVAKALSKDDLAAAKKAAAAIVKQDKDSSMAKSAGAISEAKSLDEARKDFKALSEIAVKLAKGKKGYYVLHCPMVKGGGGDWLQTDKKVANPYFGASMLECGGVKE